MQLCKEKHRPKFVLLLLNLSKETLRPTGTISTALRNNSRIDKTILGTDQMINLVKSQGGLAFFVPDQATQGSSVGGILLLILWLTHLALSAMVVMQENANKTCRLGIIMLPDLLAVALITAATTMIVVIRLAMTTRR